MRRTSAEEQIILLISHQVGNKQYVTNVCSNCLWKYLIKALKTKTQR
jgi:hypothetical protein